MKAVVITIVTILVLSAGAGAYFYFFTDVFNTKSVQDPNVTISDTIEFAYGTYNGDVKNGKANGMGKMIYTQRKQISAFDSAKRYAEVGQYVVGTWHNNQLDFGKLYDKNGVLIETLIIGRAE